MQKEIEILLVEDNPGDVRLLKEALQEVNLSVQLRVVSDGTEALILLRPKNDTAAYRPDLIISDINLPKLNGIELLEELKSDKVLKSIPVVMMTTSTSPEDIKKSYEKHANCYLVKEQDFDNFFNSVHLLNNFWLNTVQLPT